MVSAPPKPGIENMLSEVKAQTEAPVTYISRVFEPGQKIWLPQAMLLTFEQPTCVVMNDSEFEARRMFLAHYSPMWMEAEGRVKATYLIPGIVKLPEKEEGITAYPRQAYIIPMSQAEMPAVITGHRRDQEMEVLHGRELLLENYCPQLVYVDGKRFMNIDRVNIGLQGPVAVAEKAAYRNHYNPLEIMLAGAEVSYK